MIDAISRLIVKHWLASDNPSLDVLLDERQLAWWDAQSVPGRCATLAAALIPVAARAPRPDPEEPDDG